MERTGTDGIKKILVFQTAFLGDVVLSTPVFANLKERFPEAEVTALVIPQNAPVLSGNPYIDSIIAYDKKNPKKIAGFLGILKEIRKHRFDIVFSLHRSFRTALVLYLSGIPRRIGFSDSSLRFAYTTLVERDLSRHDVIRNLSILKAAGMEETQISDELLITYSDEDKSAMLGKLKNADGEKPVIVVNPGSVWATKRYPPSSYAEVIRMFKNDDRYDIVISGAKDDRGIAREIISLCGGGVFDLTGETSLKELAALLDHASLMITNDSGPMHIASAFNTHIVAIFGPTTSQLGFFPYNKNSVVVERELDCRPCGKHGGAVCPIKTFDCMRLIRPEEVYEAAANLLGKAG